ncbi:Quinone oxidoreductase [Microbacterium esteraromaticum]|uniref:Quinone oxidoreductase n=1 Tax=Microbacterium esteraromaticum TaxID=57043 RepID=A0A1R4JY80_9MICO|nr:NAD(P)H-quinone oxidoreductase [Microbacterium esteraromaticum]SJN37007.1 Quinone oxidoreductase [Microbacterium esteraromaticum]
MPAVVFTGSGGNEVVAFVERADPAPGADEVLIKVRYAGLNHADLGQRRGTYPAPAGTVADIPGLEVAGTVLAIGDHVDEWRVGDRVMGLIGGGGLADRVVTHRRHLVRIPDSIDDRSAAAFPEAFATAHDAIRSQAQLRMGETLLVQGANGGVGSAAIQIAVAAGARAIGTSRSADGRAFVDSLGGEGISPTGCVDEIQRLAGGAGVDVVLELVGAPNIPNDIEMLRTDGRIVVIGIGAGSHADLPLGLLLTKRATIRASGLRYRNIEEKALVMRNLEREVLPHLSRGSLVTSIDHVFSAADVQAAFDHLENGSKRGKVLIEFA